MIVLSQIFHGVCQWKNCENLLRTDKFIDLTRYTTFWRVATECISKCSWCVVRCDLQDYWSLAWPPSTHWKYWRTRANAAPSAVRVLFPAAAAVTSPKHTNRLSPRRWKNPRTKPALTRDSPSSRPWP